jgi:hypothetical protein
MKCPSGAWRNIKGCPEREFLKALANEQFYLFRKNCLKGKKMIYKKVTRAIFGNTMYIRILDGGDTEILQDKEWFDANGKNGSDSVFVGEAQEEYRWDPWATKELWNEVWLVNDGDGDIEISDITLEEILEELEE